ITSFLDPFPDDNPLAIATSPWVDFNRSGFNEMVNTQTKISALQEQFLLSSFVNLSPNDPTTRGINGVALYMGPMAKNLGSNPFKSFTTLISNTIAHEVGHVLGMI